MIEYTVKVYDVQTEWYLNGKLHREDGPAITHQSGEWGWYLNGKLHRDGGPAMQIEGDEAWYQHGKLHNTHGPAITYADGSKAWFLNGVELTEEEFDSRFGEGSPPIIEVGGMIVFKR